MKENEAEEESAFAYSKEEEKKMEVADYQAQYMFKADDVNDP